MQSKLSVIVLSILSLCSVTACNDEPKKTDDSAVAVTKPATPEPWKMFETVQEDIGVGPVVNVSIDFGIKSQGNMMECKPGAGICAPPKLAGPRSTTTAQIVGNTLRITVSTNTLKSTNPTFYDSMMQYKMNGFMTFEDSYTFDTAFCSQLGNTTGITIENGSPFSFNASGNDASQEMLYFYGAIPGNSACINFSPCNGEAYTTALTFSSAAAGCAGKAYTTFLNKTTGTGSLTLVMKTEEVIALSGGCIALDTNWQAGYVSQFLNITSDFVFSDPAVAASVSVPVGTVLPQSTNSAYITFMPSGWCTLNFYVTLPPGTVAGK